MWFTVFGNSAIWLENNIAGLSQFLSSPEALLFEFLQYLPLPTLTSIIALIVIALFFITSADAGIYVLNNIASRDKGQTAPKWQALMWGVLMSIVSITLLSMGGLGTLQTMTLIAALPFSMLMLLMCASLWKGVCADKKYFTTKITPTSTFWTGDSWKERLGQMLNQTQEKDIVKFLKRIALPAMRELRQELINVHNLNVEVLLDLEQDESSVEIHIKKASMRDFIYGIKSTCHNVAEHLINDEALPHIQHQMTYQPITYFFDGRLGYDVQYMSKNELIADILKQYERYLSLLENVGQELMAHEQTELAE